jgi:hypothetical protein
MMMTKVIEHDDDELVGLNTLEDIIPAHDKNNNDHLRKHFAEAVMPVRRRTLPSRTFWNQSNYRQNKPPQHTNSLLLASLETEPVDAGVAWHSDQETITFAFPNAPIKHTEDRGEECIDSKVPFKDENKNQKDESEQDEELEEEGGGEKFVGEEIDIVECGDENVAKPATEPQTELYVMNLRHETSFEFPQSRRLASEGLGSDPVLEEKKERPLTRMWRRLGRGNSGTFPTSEEHEMDRSMKRADAKSLRSMKVATEETRNEKSRALKITKAALAAMVPVLFDDDNGDGLNNLGMYNEISSSEDEAENDTKVNPSLKWQEHVFMHAYMGRK